MLDVPCLARTSVERTCNCISEPSTASKEIRSLWLSSTNACWLNSRKTSQANPAQTFKWFSRHRLWLFAHSLGLDGVSALSDSEYLQGLANINDYFTKHPAARQTLRLEPFLGPQTLADRHSLQESYLGHLQIFQYYDRAVFVAQLKSVAATLTIATASESQFMLALRQTSERMRNWAMLRGVPAIAYRGPQSFIHRDALDRLNFLVSDVLSPKDSRASCSVPDDPHNLMRPLHLLQCDACGKQRRVDLATFAVFSAVTWEAEALSTASAEILNMLRCRRSFLLGSSLRQA